MSLRSDIKKVLSNVEHSFHMPGHKYSKLFDNIDKSDTTEITGTDNLHDAGGVILEAEKRASQIYGSKKTRFLVGGSTAGILSSIYASCNRGDGIIIARDSHKSVYNACRIAGLNYVTVMPKISEANLPYSYNDKGENFFVSALKKHKDIKVVVVNSPNYYGYVMNIREIAVELEKRNGTLIVDEAHGAHFEFCGLREYSALNNGGDIIIQSAHKTLPAMTMSAMVHYGESMDKEKINKVDKALSMFQSSSPSYPLMYSIDEAISYMDDNRENNVKKMSLFKEFRQSLPFDLIKNVPEPKDLSKIFLNSSEIGYTGYDFEKILQNHGIFPEFALKNGVLLYLSVVNTEDDLNRTLEILNSIEKKTYIYNEVYSYPKVENSFNKDFSKFKEKNIPIEKSSGKISAEDVIPYPPGIPIILSGEIINNDVIRWINCYNNRSTIKIFD